MRDLARATASESCSDTGYWGERAISERVFAYSVRPPSGLGAGCGGASGRSLAALCPSLSLLRHEKLCPLVRRFVRSETLQKWAKSIVAHSKLRETLRGAVLSAGAPWY
jgi:hypothetical protein